MQRSKFPVENNPGRVPIPWLGAYKQRCMPWEASLPLMVRGRIPRGSMGCIKGYRVDTHHPSEPYNMNMGICGME